jgi:phage terminase large subunit-like protein
MSRRESDTSRRKLTADEQKIRDKQEAKAFEIGVPLCPDQYVYNRGKLYDLWKKRAKQLLDARLLAYSDGEALLEFCRAELAGDSQRTSTIFKLTWESRAPFPAPVKLDPGKISLPDFLEAVKKTRTSYAARRSPSASVCMDTNGQPYTWPEGDAATIARAYAMEVLAGTVISGELMRRSAARFIADLESAHERGIYFDPVAARDVKIFSELFCDLKLLPWQVFVLANVFGWKKGEAGYRRFVEVLLSVAKKNGKTKLSSVVALWGLIADCEKHPEVYSAATKREQARIVWRDAKRAVGDNAELFAYVKRWAGELAVPATDGFFQPLSSDEKSMDGLRPHFIICDEVSFWDSRDQWDKLAKGVVSRDQPLVFAITTAGTSRTCFAFGKFDLAEKILTGTFADDSTFVAIFRIDSTDDWKDEAVWAKANPSLGVTLKAEHLQKTRDEAVQDGSGLNSFLQLHMNVWPDKNMRREGSITRTKWNSCSHLELLPTAKDPDAAYTQFMNLNKDSLCFVGLDVGLTSDMTAIAYLWDHAYLSADERDKSGKVIKDADCITNKRFLLVEFFMPEDGLLEKEKAWRVPLSTWVREKWIQLLPGDLTDPRDIRNHIMETARVQSIQELGFDKWNAMQICADINSSTAVKCIEIPQIPSQLTNPCREFLADIRRDELVHFNNPVLAWNVSNVILAEDVKTGGIKPEKLSASEKIDGVQATVNAYHRMLAAPPRFTGRLITI